MNQVSRADHSPDAPRPSRSGSLRGGGVRHLVATSCALLFALASATAPSTAQAMSDLPAMEDAFEAGAPGIEMGGGDFFSQELGTLLRLRYNTESYGQDRRGNFDIGTMQVQSFEDAIAFFDGQVTLNDVNGVGYNVGVGFRWLHWSPFLIEPERITGFSFWADGTSTESGNFFPQVGLSFESLGDRFDLRINGYIPVGQESQIGSFTPTGAVGYNQNFLVLEAVADRNTSFNVAEAELAARLMADRDAWAFAGPYTLVNDEEDTAGYRVGVRGYAYPDLLVQLAVTDDDIFKTNAAFQVTWFVGRTRTNFQPACGLPDRMREPVMRNDYVALRRTQEFGGEPLLDTSGNPFRFVHVNSAAPNGGNGTFENPLNDIGNVQPNSQTGDIVLLYSDSVFTSQNSLILQDRQRLLGEGNNEFFTINTQQLGTVVIPETSPGARAGARPVIFGALGDAIVLADANEVANINIDGNGVTDEGIAASALGAGNPNLHDLRIENVLGNGIETTPFVRVNATNNNLKTVAGNVTINNVVFDNNGGDDIHINAATMENINNPNITLQEVINISNITSTNVAGTSLFIENTHSGNGRTTTITNYDYDGGTGTGGGMRFLNFDGTLNASASTIVGGTDSGVFVGSNGDGDSDGTFTFANTFTIENVDTDNAATEAAFVVDGFTGILTMNGTIDNDTGRSLLIQNVSENTAGTTAVTFNGDITDDTSATSRGILIQENDGGTILLAGDITVSTTNFTAIELLNNEDGTNQADINFTGELSITSSGGNGFDATGGGILTVAGTTNTIDTTGGIGLRITDMEISAAGASFAEVNASGGTNGIVLEDNTGGPISVGTVGDDPGEGGLIEDTTDDAIVINNSANVTITGVRINNGTNAVAGVHVEHTTAEDMELNLNDLRIDGGQIGIDVLGGSTEDLTMTVNDTDINGEAGTTTIGMRFNNVDNGTVDVANVTIDGNGAMATAGVQIIGSDATFDFDNATMIQEVSGTSFEISGGDVDITMAGDITNTAGRAIDIHNITNGNVTFTVDNVVSASAASTGVRIADNLDGVIDLLGDYNLSTGANDAVTITGNNNNAEISIGSLDIDTTMGSGFVATGGGELTVLGTNNTINSTALGAGNHGLQIENMTIASVSFESVSTAGGGQNGIRLVDNAVASGQTGMVTIGDTGAAVNAGGIIAGTTDAGVHVTNTNVTLNGVTVNNAGTNAGDNGVEIFHTGSDTMNANLNRVTVNNATPDRDGVLLDGTGNTGTFNANIQNLDVNVTGDGLVVNDGVTLTAGGTNTIDTATGVGLTVTNSTIAAAGANFQNVTVTGGTSNGIVIQDVTGGQIAVTGIGTNMNSGGSLTTAGTAVLLTNVENVDLNNLQIVASAVGIDIDHTAAATTEMDVTINNLNLDAAAGDGINLSADNDSFGMDMRLVDSDIDNANVIMDVTGAAHFGLLVDSTDISTDVGAAGRAFDLQIHDGATSADVTIRSSDNANPTEFRADDGEALFIDSFDATAKSIRILVEDSSFIDSTGTGIAADIRNRGNSLMQLTVQGNTFASAGAARDLSIASSGTAASQMRLNLGGDPTEPEDMNTAAGQGTLFVSQAGTSVFSIFERDRTIDPILQDRNNDPVITNGGTFQNLAVPPALPVVP